jgi:acyl-CoA dehydrogenase family protein 9
MNAERPAETLGAIRSLFLGELDDATFYPYPEQDPDEKEACGLAVEAFRDWAKDNLDPVKIDRDQEIPLEVRTALGEMGILGMTVPEEFGGSGFGTTAYCRVMEEVTRADGSLSVFVGAHLSIGAKPIILFGSDEMRKKYLPRIATGEKLCAFALTEPGAGSDAGSLRTRAEWDEAKGAFRINGNKIWITNGGYADVFSVFARAHGGPIPGEGGITAFLVERGMPGFTNGPSEHKMGIRGSSTTELAFQDVVVGPERIIGAPANGFAMATRSLETGRLSLGAGSAGASKELLRLAARHAREREQFRRAIIDFGMIREKLGRMAAATYGAESMVYLTAGLVDRGGLDMSIEAGYCKVFGSETLWQVVNDAVQVAGGIGYMTEYPYERHLRDSRINLIFEGTNEILRLAGTLEGLKEPGRRATEALRAAKTGAGAALAEAALGGSIAGPVRLPRWIPEPLAAQGENFAATLALFGAKVAEVMKRHRRAILGQEYVLRRLADAAMRVYATAAALSRASSRIEKLGAEGASRDILLASRFVDEACKTARRELEDIETVRDELDDAIAEDLREQGRYAAAWF